MGNVKRHLVRIWRGAYNSIWYLWLEGMKGGRVKSKRRASGDIRWTAQNFHTRGCFVCTLSDKYTHHLLVYVASLSVTLWMVLVVEDGTLLLWLLNTYSCNNYLHRYILIAFLPLSVNAPVLVFFNIWFNKTCEAWK